LWSSEKEAHVTKDGKTQSNESVEAQWHNKKVSRPIQFFK